MGQQDKIVVKDRKKVIIINSLYAATILIMFLGLYFGAYSVINNISLQVLSARIPGVIFGLLVVYLGVRYYLSVSKFKSDFYQNTSKFSWSNFKREKKSRVNPIDKYCSIIRR